MDNLTLENLISKLSVQKDAYQSNEVEALNGPDPTQTRNTVGSYENATLKKQSKQAWGDKILSFQINALGVIAINTSDDQVSNLDLKWKQERMNVKFPLLARDRKIGGVGYMVLSLDDDKESHWSVISPKEIITASIDPVNNEYPDFALQCVPRTENGVPVNYYLVWDSTILYTYKQTGDNNYNLIDSGNHGFSSCPVMPFYDDLFSDGEVYSTMDKLIPSLQNLRQKNAELSSVAYWNSSKMSMITGVDMEATKLNAAGEIVFVYADILRELSNLDNAIHLLPKNEQGDNPNFVQSQEGNLIQLIATEKSQKENLASLASIPLSILDGSVTPQTSEAATQEYAPFKSIVKKDQNNFEEAFYSMFRLSDKGEGNDVDYNTEIIWKPIDESSLNVLADTVSKLTSSGVPLEWVVKNVLKGFDSQAINDLLDSIQGDALLPRGVTSLNSTTAGPLKIDEGPVPAQITGG
jgi:hypothetical protein